MKKPKIYFFIAFLIVCLIYVTNITGVPKNIILFQGERLNLNTVFGINIKEKNSIEYKATQVSSTNVDENNEFIGKKDYEVNFLGLIPVKEVSVNIIPKAKVVPVGSTIGLKLYTNGVLVVGMSEIKNSINSNTKPYQNSGIKEGDLIVSVNKKEVSTTIELIEQVNKSKGENIDIQYVRNGEALAANIKPAKVSESEYKLGLWVRDAAAGVGTVSFYEPSTGGFAALGHGILDIDTEELISISTGEVVTTDIVSITKGEKGKPGEMKGSIANQSTIGEIVKNTEFGIYGKLTNLTTLSINKEDEIEVALRDEIELGPAKIICTLQNNVKAEYDIEIEKIYKNNDVNNKSMLIKITDKDLLEKTGGIIQGMSGSPIIQNGKFIGAVTHVIVNDPCKGYAVFGDIMIKKIREVN